jgi:hypothetical protein
MSMKSLSDHLTATSRDTAGHMSEASPVDEESSGGWSDDDSATIKSEFTDVTYGTLGSAVVVDATAMTSTEEATKKIRRMVAAKAAQSKEDIIPGLPPSANASQAAQSKEVIIPGLPPSAKASLGEDILFTPPLEVSDGSESDNDGADKKANKASKKKKKKKSKKTKDASSSDRDIDVSDIFDESVDPPKKKKVKKKKKDKDKKKEATVQEEDIVFDFNENAGTEEEHAADRSKKKKKKKKRKGDASSGDDSNDVDSDNNIARRKRSHQ